MSKSWGQARDEWLKRTSLEKETSSWAIESLSKNESKIYALESLSKERSKEKLEEIIRELKRSIKNEILEKETSIDELSLNTANSSKLQVSVPSSLNYLMKAWAAAEGRDLSSVALQCLESGLRTMKSKGSIPSVAIERYDVACKKRIALAEVNNVWDKYESLNLKQIYNH